MPKTHLRRQARRDLIKHFVYLADTADIATAERFFANAQTSFDLLAKTPLIGSPLTLRNPRLAGMRKWRVEGFDNALIFYMPRAGVLAAVFAVA